MAGTLNGGKLAAETNKRKYGPDYYKRIGAMGGKMPKRRPSGFAYMAIHDREKLSEASALGGRISRKGRK